MGETRRPGGRGFGQIQATTEEGRDLALFLRDLLGRTSYTLRDLEKPACFGRTQLSAYFSGAQVPEGASLERIVAYLSQPLVRQRNLDRAQALLRRVQAATAAPVPEQATPPSAETVDTSLAGALARVAATAQDQAAHTLEELTKAQARNDELITERYQAQQMVVALRALTVDLQRQIDETAARHDPEVDTLLEELNAQLEGVHAELARARTSRDEAGELAQRLQLRIDELEEQVALLRQGTAAVPGPHTGATGLPPNMQEALFQQDVDRMLHSVQQFLDNGQAGRDHTRDEWGLPTTARTSSSPATRWRTAARLQTRILGCTAIIVGTAGRQLAIHHDAPPGWPPLLTLTAVIGLILCGDLAGPTVRVGKPLLAWLLAQPLAQPVRFSAQDLARCLGRALLGILLAALSLLLAVTAGGKWAGALWMLLLPAIVCCAGFIAAGNDRELRTIAQERIGRWAARLQAPRTLRGAREMSVQWSDSEWLAARRAELGQALDGGWRQTALWVKAVLGVGALYTLFMAFIALVLLIPLDAVADPQLPYASFAKAADLPVRAYLAAHTDGLPVSAAAVRVVWLAAGAVLILIGCATRNFGARLTWVLWGAATAAMVWWGTEGPARQVATGLAVLWWGLASVAALRGIGTRAPSTAGGQVIINGNVTGETTNINEHTADQGQ
ncbi:hypothetical protein [Kitasatospora sp. NPDC096140]|uniref:hypothetical protein n=1 Tax=Kitasatospora sp. NPDC096140 TaxID=3155425 RepID=UPI003326FFA0